MKFVLIPTNASKSTYIIDFVKRDFAQPAFETDVVASGPEKSREEGRCLRRSLPGSLRQESQIRAATCSATRWRRLPTAAAKPFAALQTVLRCFATETPRARRDRYSRTSAISSTGLYHTPRANRSGTTPVPCPGT